MRDTTNSSRQRDARDATHRYNHGAHAHVSCYTGQRIRNFTGPSANTPAYAGGNLRPGANNGANNHVTILARLLAALASGIGDDLPIRA